MGGSLDRLQVFLTERAERPDQNIKALPRSLLALYFMFEKRLTVMQSVKKNGPVKADGQRAELTPWCTKLSKLTNDARPNRRRR